MLREACVFFFFFFDLWYQFVFSLFNWSIVDLQCCVSFGCPAKWFSYTYMYINSFLDSFPLWVIAEY